MADKFASEIKAHIKKAIEVSEREMAECEKKELDWMKRLDNRYNKKRNVKNASASGRQPKERSASQPPRQRPREQLMEPPRQVPRRMPRGGLRSLGEPSQLMEPREQVPEQPRQVPLQIPREVPREAVRVAPRVVPRVAPNESPRDLGLPWRLSRGPSTEPQRESQGESPRESPTSESSRDAVVVDSAEQTPSPEPSTSRGRSRSRQREQREQRQQRTDKLRIGLLVPVRGRPTNPNRRYYVMERLTQEELLLYEWAQFMVQQAGWHSVYIEDGKIFVEFRENSRPFAIRSYRDLCELSNYRWSANRASRKFHGFRVFRDTRRPRSPRSRQEYEDDSSSEE
ncbi:unnamed protein product [Chrysodeixis includens]|uniref:Uncharacterized protein n=1 Tax=Chrysodeixis includens TaxID=689277 RepID=A0A9N8KP25_CHRIL|nr:unnamed protein product [Chrysodeixis includens]